MVDEATCADPQHDSCLDALQISASGTYAMDTTGATFDYPTSCGLGNMPGGAPDVAAAVVLPPGPPVDVEVRAGTIGYQVGVAIAGLCGDPSSELACSKSFYSPMGGTLAKV